MIFMLRNSHLYQSSQGTGLGATADTRHMTLGVPYFHSGIGATPGSAPPHLRDSGVVAQLFLKPGTGDSRAD